MKRFLLVAVCTKVIEIEDDEDFLVGAKECFQDDLIGMHIKDFVSSYSLDDS